MEDRGAPSAGTSAPSGVPGVGKRVAVAAGPVRIDVGKHHGGAPMTGVVWVAMTVGGTTEGGAAHRGDRTAMTVGGMTEGGAVGRGGRSGTAVGAMTVSSVRRGHGNQSCRRTRMPGCWTGPCGPSYAP